MLKTIPLIALLLLTGCGTIRGPVPMLEIAATAGLVGLTLGALGERSYEPIYGGFDRPRGYHRDYDRGYRRGRNQWR